MRLKKFYPFILLILLLFLPWFFKTPIKKPFFPPKEKKQIAIIVNPISGGSEKNKLIEEIQKELSPLEFETQIFYTNGPNHATQLAKTAVKSGVEILVVVGGDGSVNEVGQALIGSQTILAIIPTGSGNGISRHLQIPQETLKAIQLIHQGAIKTIDTVCINDRHYLGVAGIGFDAEISWDFADFGHRGFFSYLLLALKKLPLYHPHKYHLSIDGREMTERAFLICFANSSQFGNGAFIAPNAQIDDGLLETVIIKKFPLYASLQIAHQLFDHSLNHSEYVEIIKCKEVNLNCKNLKAHIDGEPVLFENGIHLKVLPSSLKVLVPTTPSV